MTIANVIQKGKNVYIYNDRGVEQAILRVGSLPGSGLTGWTSSTVSIQQGVTIYTYNENGGVVGNGIHVGNNSDSEFPAVSGDFSFFRFFIAIILAVIFYNWYF